MINFTVYFKNGTKRVLKSTRVQAVANYINLKYRNSGIVEYMEAEGYTYTLEDINSMAIFYRKQLQA
jgi:hypothetical protein